ncbi:hypothetical protein ACOMHN_029429 [Nucella lapillus]
MGHDVACDDVFHQLTGYAGANPSPDHVKSSEVFPEEYNVFRKDRNCLGGGIFILIHKSLTAVEQPELSTDCEILWAKLKLQNRKDLNVGCFYMPHRNKHDIEQLDKSINLLTQNGKKDCPIVLNCTMTEDSENKQQASVRMSPEVLVIGSSSKLRQEDMRRHETKVSKGTAKRITFIIIFIAIIGSGFILLRGQWRRISGGLVQTFTSTGDSLAVSQTIPGPSVALAPRVGLSGGGGVPRPQKLKASYGHTDPDQDKNSAEQLTLQLLQQQAKILQLLDDKLKQKQQQHTGEEARSSQQEGLHPQYPPDPTRRPKEWQQEQPGPTHRPKEWQREQPDPTRRPKDWQREQPPVHQRQPVPVSQVPYTPVPKPYPEYEHRSVSSHKQWDRTYANGDIPPHDQPSKSSGFHRQAYMAPTAKNREKSALQKRARYTNIAQNGRRILQENRKKATQKPPEILDAASLFKTTHEKNEKLRSGLFKKITVNNQKGNVPNSAQTQENKRINAAKRYEKSELMKWAERAARVLENPATNNAHKPSEGYKLRSGGMNDAAQMFGNSHHKTQYRNRLASRRLGRK